MRKFVKRFCMHGQWLNEGIFALVVDKVSTAKGLSEIYSTLPKGTKTIYTIDKPEFSNGFGEMIRGLMVDFSKDNVIIAKTAGG